ncbi:DUF2946 domain-containing protein [Pseudomonas agarici]|uniref:DUF2946 domain-containing protein n=1 Tax=Pseudomonas agarici TaxID=46677 RepID=UPI0015A122C3|nr:DUF2946 domain-containing protein [Pseudomonas agarici]NWB93190.1 DUF2946 domain-containing protein [Pseudomonas agarici]
MISFLSLRTFRRHSAACLSLFAMLLVFAGPLIGQASGEVHGTPVDPDDICGAVPGGYIAGADLTSEHGTDPDSQRIRHWEKCGYCSLLFQHPALADSNAALGYLGIWPISRPTSTSDPQRIAAPIFPGSRSRAPPSRA